MGVIAWVVLVVGALGGLAIVAQGSSCEESLLNDCSEEQTAGIVLGLVAFGYSFVAALLFFAARHILLLLAEIAEKD